jgi:hypothetical protein
VTLFWEFVDNEAALIRADGCSKASGAYRKCCRVHDLAYVHGKDPVDAYRKYIAGDLGYWLSAAPITRVRADADLRRCVQANQHVYEV